MSQSTENSSIVNRTDGKNRSTKPSDTLRPHYHTTFQSSCCGEKVNTTTSTQNKNILPIPEKFKTDAERLLTPINQTLIEDLAKISEYTSVIPDIFFEKNDYQIQKYLVDRVMLKTLEEVDIINWIKDLKKLYPIRTSGNGNCLLHAVLIAMIGIHDCNLYLRDRLAQFMNDNKDILKTHWRIERLKSDKTYGISSEDSKLDDEWKELCDLVYYENSEDGQAATNLQFLEAVHIFSISNMLHRSIIVLSEDVIRNKNGEPISVNDLFGIYLPILSSSNECINEPIVLAYDRSHFCPLQTDDINRDKTSDNLLPIYPSINHIYEQNLLPIRFLGDDVTAERSKNLLYEYLRIQTVEYSFDSNSSAIPVLCVQLGSKNLPLKENFFLLYYKYVKDFFEIQKPQAIEDERKRERQRELEEYVSQHTSYDTYGRSIIKQDTSPTRSPRSNYTMNDVQSRHQTNYSNEPQYSHNSLYNNDAYLPRTSGINFENPPIQSQRLPDYAKKTLRDPSVGDTRFESYKDLYPRNITDNINNLNNNERQQNTVQIPIQVVKQNTSSNNQNLTIYERSRPSFDRDICVLCDQPFYDLESRRICAKCDYKISNPTSYNDFNSRPSSRSRSTHLYMPVNDRSYSPVLSTIPKTRAQGKIICPHCRNPNLSYNLTSNSDFRCSVCQNPISLAYRYWTSS